MVSRRAAFMARLCALVALLFFFSGTVRAAEDQSFIVQNPGMGPMLLRGPSLEDAVNGYIESLIRRDVFGVRANTMDVRTEDLRALGRELVESAHRAPTLAAMRSTGRPIVGIQLNKYEDVVGSPSMENWSAEERAKSAKWKTKRTRFATAVAEAGGVPVFLPPAMESKHIEPAVSELDHLVLMGGSDVHPALQQDAKPSGDRYYNLQVDTQEIEVIRAALRRKIGVHGVCRGGQLLAVAFHGRLIADLPTSGLTTMKHGSGQAGQGPYVRFYSGDSMGMHFHHQAVDPRYLPPNFVVTETARDGIIEGFRSLDGLIHADQTHPELLAPGARRRDRFFAKAVEIGKATMVERGRSLEPSGAFANKSERSIQQHVHALLPPRPASHAANAGALFRPLPHAWQSPSVLAPVARAAHR